MQTVLISRLTGRSVNLIFAGFLLLVVGCSKGVRSPLALRIEHFYGDSIPDSANKVIVAGWKSDPKDVPSLVELLKEGNEFQVWAAAKVISILGPAGEPAVPELVRLLGHDNRVVRQAALVALGKIGAPAIPALADALSHSDPDIRIGAIAWLAGCGELASVASPALLEVLKNGPSGERLLAIWALGECRSQQAASSLEKILADVEADSYLRESAAEALSKIRE